MRIIKLIICEEHLLGDGKKDPYRKQKDIYNMKGELVYSFDIIDQSIDANIKEMFR